MSRKVNDIIRNAYLDKLHMQVDAGFRRRDPIELESIFRKNLTVPSGHYPVLPRENLELLLEELGVDIESAEAKELLKTNANTELDFETFRSILQKDNRLREWAKTIPFHEVLADSIPRRNGQDPLRVISELTSNEWISVFQAMQRGLIRLLQVSAVALKEALVISDARKQVDDGSKFNIIGMSCGDYTDFHAGIEGRLGIPSLKFEQTVEAEHCLYYHCDQPFTSVNYQVVTTPKKEWGIVAREDSGADMRHNRKLQSLEELMARKEVADAKLSRVEVTAVVLYTGPMFQLYNTVLRRWPEEKFQALKNGNNIYTTTIYVLSSAVISISRETKLPLGTKLYRGLGGDKTFPPHFHQSDDKGRRGVLEWGFMSTTADKAIAIQYSGVQEGKPFPTIMEISAATVDRGADISCFSQYPDERECLFPPCSFLEPVGGEAVEASAHGILSKVQVRLNTNLKARSLQQLVEQKRRMHLAAFAYLLDELEKELLEQAQGAEARAREEADQMAHECRACDLCDAIMEQCRAVLAAHESCTAEDYHNDDLYRSLVSESLDAKEMGKNKFRLWLHGREFAYYLRPKPLKGCNRQWNLLQETELANEADDERAAELALALCRGNGLVMRSVDERSSHGETPLIAAAADGERGAFLGLLVKARADVNATTTDRAESAVLLAATYGRVHAIEALALLGASVAAPDKLGRTPVLAAARNGLCDAIRALAGAGADVSTPDREGRTPLHAAAVYGHAGAIEALAQLGAGVETADREGRTPVYSAAMYGHAAAVAALVRRGASVSTPCASGRSPLLAAEEAGHAEVAQVLRRLGAQ